VLGGCLRSLVCLGEGSLGPGGGLGKGLRPRRIGYHLRDRHWSLAFTRPGGVLVIIMVDIIATMALESIVAIGPSVLIGKPARR